MAEAKVSPFLADKKKKPFDPIGAEKMLFARSGVNGVAHLFPNESTSGNVTIKKTVYDNDTLFTLDNMRHLRDGNDFMMMYPGEYAVLKIDRDIVMSDTNMERITNREFIKAAHGDILIGGLGIGLLLHNILEKPEVHHVTVVEANQNVINLVSPAFVHSKLTIVHDDAFTYKPNRKMDCIYMDIWKSINTDNLQEMQLLALHYRRFRARGSYFDCWMQKHLKKIKRREERTGY